MHLRFGPSLSALAKPLTTYYHQAVSRQGYRPVVRGLSIPYFLPTINCRRASDYGIRKPALAHSSFAFPITHAHLSGTRHVLGPLYLQHVVNGTALSLSLTSTKRSPAQPPSSRRTTYSKSPWMILSTRSPLRGSRKHAFCVLSVNRLSSCRQEPCYMRDPQRQGRSGREYYVYTTPAICFLRHAHIPMLTPASSDTPSPPPGRKPAAHAVPAPL